MKNILLCKISYLQSPKSVCKVMVYTYQKSSSIKFSIEHAAAIRTPSLLATVALSIPRSSARNICIKSPTLCDTGRKTN